MSDARNRGCVVLWLCLAVLSACAARATDYQEVKLSCPVDGTRFVASVISSFSSFGQTSDLRPLWIGVDGFVESLATCPTCKFTVEHSRFAKPKGLDAARIRRAISELRSQRFFWLLDLAMAVERSWTDDPQTVAHLALAAKWEADDTGEPKVIRDRTIAAIAAEERAWNAPPPEPVPDESSEGEPGDEAEEGDDEPEDEGADARTTNAYLVGELHRQLGNGEEASLWLERALASSAASSLEPLVRRQLFLARNVGKPEEQVLALAKDGSAPERLAAVELLKGSSSTEILKFLEVVCLEGDPSDREEALQTLLGTEQGPDGRLPRAFHAPIFLRALEGDTERAVQLGARAIEKLGLREAMPRLLKKIDTCTHFEEYRLFAALAPLATEQDARALKGLLGSPRCGKGSRLRGLLLKALLETRSAEAVPAILELAADGAHSREDQELETKAAAFGPALLAALPDIGSGGSSDVLAAWKVKILGRLDSPESLASLIATHERGGPLALEAALSLLRRRDPRGKARILEDLAAIHDRWRGELTLLPPFLEAPDFGTIRRQMEACRERAWKRVEENRDRAAKEGEDFLEDGNWDFEVEDYLPLLGATRNPAARPVLLSYLDRENSAQLRKAAIDGLVHFHDGEIAQRLRGLLAAEGFYVVDAILASAAKTKDAGQVDALLALMNEPTPVETKVAWTQALEVLAPAKAVPFWESWSRSPDPRLKALSSAALARAVRDR